MRASDPVLTSQRVALLQALNQDSDSDLTRPLYMDDLTALAKLDLIRLDHDAHVSLTDKGRRIVAGQVH